MNTNMPNQGINAVLKQIVSQAILRSRLLQTPSELEELLEETVCKVDRAFHVQDQILNEKEVEQRWSFLNVKKLRNMRFRHIGPAYFKIGNARRSRVYYKVADIEAWIIKNYQLKPFVLDAAIPENGK